MFDPKGYARELLQIESVVKHFTTIEDYWVDCKDEFEIQERDFSKLIVGKIKPYNISFNVEGLEDDGKNMYSNTYLTKLRNTLINSKPYDNVEEDLDIMMDQIIKRTRKSFEWTAKISQSKSTTT